MNLRNCKRCGKLYTYNGIDICPECYKKDEEDFKKIRDYIDANPSATMIEVSRATEVTIKKIMDFLKEGRLILGSQNINIILKCERCGRQILSGRYCEDCSREIEKTLRKGLFNNINTEGSDDQDKLYLRDRIKNNRKRI
ncbi:TIGR03826 family flagellar region protein [Thermoanaerobacterium sp. RBIITD]|uniref:TIGR03826 family flagellar region protein n=1 Tax=Thermoanaerobacterium sp. RBIITD TaxID=1550240 RepID=UPI000BB720A2|nr:TIGR03826 family flagellar region protein [Thermoanaerobacterium sp. RBIITD]SNX53132.1 flagellar operon protein TIGR03826 [Thermoanaerobacterium sp. RBIITD]